MKRLIFLLPILFLVSCAHYVDDPTKSVWSGQLWIIPVAIAIGFFICAYNAWRAWNSGTIEGGGRGRHGEDYGPVHDVTGPKGEKLHPPMKNNGYMWFAIILFVAFWVVVYVVNHGR